MASGIIDAFASAYKSVAKEFSAATKNMQPQVSVGSSILEAVERLNYAL